MKISADHLVKAYKRRRVVNDVSFSLQQGEIVGLLGPNGAGKTTTFYMMIGLVRPNEGIVKFDDRDVTTMPMYQRARIGVSYLPQEKSVFRRLSVRDNIRLVMEVAGHNQKSIKAKVDELAEELHITAILDRQASVLSGGECRRVEIARALANEPKFILLDEPFTGIDPVTIDEIQSILVKLKQKNIGILITDHNVNATLRITDYNHILIDGKVFASGDADAIRSDPDVKKFYLGRQFENPDEGDGPEAT